MANRYWVGAGNGVWNTQARWSATSGGSGGATIPTSADNVFFDANSGSGIVSISASTSCLNIDTTGFAGSITMTSSYALTIVGTFLKLTVPLTGTSSNNFYISPTAGITMSVDVNNMVTGPNVAFQGANTSICLLASNLSGNMISHSNNTLRLQGFKITASSTFSNTNLASCIIDFGATESTIEATTITINPLSVTQNSENASFICNNGTLTSSAARTFKSLTINATTAAGAILIGSPGSTFTTGITYNAAPASRLNFPTSASTTITVGHFQVNGQTEFCYVGNTSTTVGAGRVSATTTTLNNVIFDKFTALGTAPWTGDSVGVISPTLTTGITPTPFTTITATLSATTADWFNASIWDLGRAPLLDDDVIINCTAATATLTNTGGRALNIGSLTYQSTSSTVISSNLGTPSVNIRRGGYELKSGISFLSVATAPSLNLEAVYPGTYFIRSAIGLNGTACAKVVIPITSVNEVTYIVDSDFLISGVYSANYFNHLKGNLELSANCAFFRVPDFDSSGSTTRSITLNTATVQITGPSSGWYPVGTGITISAANATIELIADGVTTNRTMYMGGGTYGTIKLSGNFGGTNSIAGPGTVNTISHTKTSAFTLNISGAISVENFLIEGTSSARITMSGTNTLTKIGGGTVTLNYLTISNSTALPANTWFGGPDTTDGGGNTGWAFNTNRYWVGTGNGSYSTVARWSTTSGGVGGASEPTSAFNAIFDENSGSGIVTMGTSDVCLSIDTTGFAGSFNFTGSDFIVFGNAMITVPITGTSSHTISFRPPASSSVTINVGNNTSTIPVEFIGNPTSICLLEGDLRSYSIYVRDGTLRTQGFNVFVTTSFSTHNATPTTLDFSTSTIEAASIGINSVATVTNSSASTFITNSAGNAFTSNGTKIYGHLITNAPSAGSTNSLNISGNNTFTIGITYNAAPGSRLNFPESTTNTVTVGHFQVNGQTEFAYVGNNSTTLGAGRVSATTTTLNNVIFDKFTALGVAPWTGTSVGIISPALTTGIVKTPASTITATLSATATDWFNASIWDLGRAPLPDDDVIINCTAATATLTNTGNRKFYLGSLTYQSTASTIISSNLGVLLASISKGYELKTGISFLSLASAPSLNLEALYPGTYFIRSALGLNGIACSRVLIPAASVTGASYIVDSDFLMTGTGTANSFAIEKGNLELSANCNFFSVPYVNATGITGNPRTITLNDATVQLTGSSSVWTFAANTGITFNAGNSIIEFLALDTASKSGNMGNFNYNHIKLSGNFGGTTSLSGTSFTVNTISHTKTVAFTLSNNNTMSVENFLISGSPGARITLSNGVLIKTGGGTVTGDYLIISNSTAQPANTWFGGIDTSDGGTNTGWIFDLNRYRVGTGTSWTSTANWSTVSGGAGGVSVPTTANDVFLDENTLTALNPGSFNCRSFNTTGYAFSLTLSATTISCYGDFILTVPTTGTNSALNMNAPSGSYIIDTNSNLPVDCDIRIGPTTASSAEFSLASNISGALFYIYRPLHTNGFDISATSNFQVINLGVLDPSTSTITCNTIAVIPTTAGAIVNGENCNIILNGTRFDGGNNTFGSLTINAPTAGGTVTVNDTNTFITGLTYNAVAASILTFNAATQTIGNFVVNGNNDYPLITSSTVCNITASTTDLDLCLFKNINALGTAGWGLEGGAIGGLGNTSGFNFTPPITDTILNTTGSWFTTVNWSAGRPPLPQDEANIQGAGTTINISNANSRMIYVGALTLTATAPTIINLNLGNDKFIVAGDYSVGENITSIGGPFNISFQSLDSGVYHLSSLNTISTSARLDILNTSATYIVDTDFNTGVVNINGGNFVLSEGCKEFTCTTFYSLGTLTRNVNLGISTIKLLAPGTFGVPPVATVSLTFNAKDATIMPFQISTNTMQLSDHEYGTIKFSGTGSGYCNFPDAGIPKIKTMTSDKTTGFQILIASGKTINVENFLISGKQGALVQVTGNGGTANLVKTGGGIVSSDYLTVTNVTASPANTWYAGPAANSTLNGTTTGWIRAHAAGSGPTTNLFFGFGF